MKLKAVIYKIFYLFFVFLLLLNTVSLFAGEALEIPDNPDNLNSKIILILSKVDPDGFKDNPKTHGFSYRYEDRFLSPFDFNIYIGRLNQRSPDSIVRIESSDKGQEKVWKQILEYELLKNPPEEDARKLEKKSYILTIATNLVQPSISVMYNSYESPFYTFSDTFWTSTFYILTDAILVGSAYLYAKNKAHRKTIWENLLNKKGPPPLIQGPDAGAIWGALAITRLYRLWGGIQDTRAHNRMVELEYTFRF